MTLTGQGSRVRQGARNVAKKPHPLRSLYAAGGRYAEEAREQVAACLARHATVEEAAAELDIHRTTLQDWMREMGLKKREL